MKQILSAALFIGIIFFSCKKEKSCEGCREGNKPPIAVAGSDQVITLPTDSVSLDGSASNDPDGKISEWLWTKIEGPASFAIANSSVAKTKAKGLVTGTYQFELTVTDDKGASAKDTMMVTVDATPTSNHAPIANAGVDQTITLPTNTVTLDGSGSLDPDNNITSYVWTKVSGSSSFDITNANAVQTQITNLVEGVYQFELKVTDAGGLFSKDTMKVTVNAQLQSPDCPPSNRPFISAQLTLFGNLSIPRTRIATVTAGNKIFFAGGSNATANFSRVDIYDIPSQTWSTTELSLPREAIQAVACGNKVFFAGGMNGSGVKYSRVDIYDLPTQSWSTAELTYPAGAFFVVAAVGNKVLFANPLNANFVTGLGTTSVWVDIYDISNQSWSSTTLSEPRAGFNAVTAGNKVYFSGGAIIDGTPTSKKVDVYDNNTGSWSTTLLNAPKAFHGGIYKNGEIYWAGGSNFSDWANGDSFTCNVEIKNTSTQASTFAFLSQTRYSNISALEKNGQLVFLPVYDFRWGNTFKFDIYDVAANTWAIGVVNDMPSYFFWSSFVVANNSIFIAGGLDYCPNSGSSCQYHSQVWKLEF